MVPSVYGFDDTQVKGHFHGQGHVRIKGRLKVKGQFESRMSF